MNIALAGNLDEEQARLESAVQAVPSPDLHTKLGMVRWQKGDLQEALESFEAALALNPNHDEAYTKAADLLIEEGYTMHALDMYIRAIAACPATLSHRQNFLTVLRHFSFKVFNPDLKALLLECLQTEGVDYSGAGGVWRSVLETDPDFGPVYRLSNQKDYKAFSSAFSRIKNTAPLIDPFFLAGLSRFIVPDSGFETFATNLRRLMLENRENPVFFDGLLPLAAALAHYCALTEYIFDVSEEETAQLSKLTDSPYDICLLGCYEPLRKRDNAAALAKILIEAGAGELAAFQIGLYEKMDKAAKKIEQGAKITDTISAGVRSQYEESPYPRWQVISTEIKDEELESPLRGQKPKILVAGCGTGREAVELAATIPDAEILAVDLSMASLSYAAMKAEEFGTANITFRQDDILNLGSLDQEFDYIASSGVLHHMEDPFRGWEIITGLLKPSGLMRIALYSRAARHSIIRARKIIAAEKFAATAEDIRRFRKNSAKLLKKKDIQNILAFRDYYSLSECRDLLFHVQEHQFDLNQINDMLDRLGLKFLKFYLRDEVYNWYRDQYPNDPDAQNLENWAKFEAGNPDTFPEMYRFWCRKA